VDKEERSISTRLEQNKLYMDQQISSSSEVNSAESQTWNIAEGSDVILIRKPTASNLSHMVE
jgi:hypothetical protein